MLDLRDEALPWFGQANSKSVRFSIAGFLTTLALLASQLCFDPLGAFLISLGLILLRKRLKDEQITERLKEV